MTSQPSEARSSGTPLIVAGMRFSIFTERSVRSWVSSRRTNSAKAQAALFSDERLSSRFRLFETMTLPFFRHEAANDPDFRLCIMTSSFLPKSWSERLETLTQDIPQIDILPISLTADFPREFRLYIQRHLKPSHELICTVRIDDDDTLHAGHMASLRAHCLPENAGKILTHPYGVYLTADENGTLYAQPIKYVNNAFGIAYLAEAKGFKTIYQTGSHARLDRVYPIVPIRTQQAWIRSIHRKSDTAKGLQNINDGKWVPLATIQDSLVKAYPFLDLTAVAKAFTAA